MEELLRAKNRLEMEPNIPIASGNAWLENTVENHSWIAIIGREDKQTKSGCKIKIFHGSGSLVYKNQMIHMPTTVIATVHSCKMKIHSNFVR